MKNFKEIFEDCYGEGSANDDFQITAISAENICEKVVTKILENLNAELDDLEQRGNFQDAAGIQIAIESIRDLTGVEVESE